MLQRNSQFLTDFLPEIIYSSLPTGDTCSINIDISSAQLIRFHFSGTGINQEIFVTPGDTIGFLIDSREVKFFGPNQAAYNFFAQRDKMF